jgi:hypothetical protein
VFDTDPTHDKLKVCRSTKLGGRILLTYALQKETDPILEQVFVYDFEEQANLGW